MLKQDSIKKWFWIVPITLGLVLRLKQYLFNRSLWNDEASLAVNLVSRSFLELIKPLDYDQGAPVAFLWAVKFLMTIFGNYDYILRLLPLISGIASLFLLAKIAKEILGGSGLLAMTIWAISIPPVYFSSELKQYSTDAMCALLLLFLAHNCFKNPGDYKNFIWLGASGAFVIWLSHPSAFILAAIGISIFIEKLTGKVKIPYFWIFALGMTWVLSFALEYLVSLRYLIANDFLQNYWMKAYMPIPPWANKRWFLNTYFYLVSITTNTTDWIFGITLAILAAVGLFSLIFRKRQIGLLLLLSFTMTGLASALHKYPLKDRFMLFLAPLFLILISEAIGLLYRISKRILPRFVWLPSIILSLFLLSYVTPGLDILAKPTSVEGIKPVLEYVGKNIQPGDKLYVYHTSVTSFKYYAPFYNIDSNTAILGDRTAVKKDALDAFYDDIDALRGQGRTWFVFSDVVDCGGCEGDMHDYYFNYLKKFGDCPKSVRVINASGYLCSLR